MIHCSWGIVSAPFFLLDRIPLFRLYILDAFLGGESFEEATYDVYDVVVSFSKHRTLLIKVHLVLSKVEQDDCGSEAAHVNLFTSFSRGYVMPTIQSTATYHLPYYCSIHLSDVALGDLCSTQGRWWQLAPRYRSQSWTPHETGELSGDMVGDLGHFSIMQYLHAPHFLKIKQYLHYVFTVLQNKSNVLCDNGSKCAGGILDRVDGFVFTGTPCYSLKIALPLFGVWFSSKINF